MSVEKTVYVGPYLRLEERPTIVRVDHCEGHERRDAPFCPVCGRGVDRRFYDQRSDPSDAFFEAYEDVLQHIRAEGLDLRDDADLTVSYAIANGNPYPPHLYLTRADCGAWSRDGESALQDPAASVELFAEQRREHIEALRELGVTVTVEWGVLAWF